MPKKSAEQKSRPKSALLSPDKEKREISGRRGGQDLTNEQGGEPKLQIKFSKSPVRQNWSVKPEVKQKKKQIKIFDPSKDSLDLEHEI